MVIPWNTRRLHVEAIMGRRNETKGIFENKKGNGCGVICAGIDFPVPIIFSDYSSNKTGLPGASFFSAETDRNS